MPIQGNLRDFSTTQLLNLINLSGRTGALRLFEGVPTGEKDAMQKPKLAPGKPRAEVYFRSGKLVYANLSGQHGDLIAVLNKSGKLNDNQARVMRDKAKGTNDKALALRLIGANYVTKNDVVNSVQQYILGVVYDIMTWSQEIFRFDEGLQPSDERILVPIDLEHVIIEGARRLEKIEEITQHIENLDMCLRFPENPKEKLEGIQLSVEEWRVVSYVSPKNTIRQIAKQLNMGEIEIRRIVYGLEQAGIVEIVRPQVDGKARATAAASSRRTTAAKRQQPQVQKAVVSKLIDKLKSM
jgi:DNA-binding MarR family transcriptional regulator